MSCFYFSSRWNTVWPVLVNILPQQVSEFISSDTDCLLLASWSQPSGRVSTAKGRSPLHWLNTNRIFTRGSIHNETNTYNILSIKASVGGNNRDVAWRASLIVHESVWWFLSQVTTGQIHAKQMPLIHTDGWAFIFSCVETTWLLIHASFMYHSAYDGWTANSFISHYWFLAFCHSSQTSNYSVWPHTRLKTWLSGKVRYHLIYCTCCLQREHTWNLKNRPEKHSRGKNCIFVLGDGG